MYRHFFQFLNAHEKNLYNVIFEGAKKYQKKFNVPLQNVDITKVKRALISDCPELYFIDNDAMHYTSDSIWFDNDFCYSYDQMKKYELELEKIVSNIKGRIDKTMNAFEVELLIYNYIMDSTVFMEKYVDNYQHGVKEYIIWEYHTLIGPLLHGKGICNGITRAMQYLLLRAGFEVVYIEGQSTKGATRYEKSLPDNHAWVIVKVGRDYYHLDVSHSVYDKMTFLNNNIEHLSYKYFNLSDKDIAKTHFYDTDRYKNPICSETKYNYFVYNNIFFQEEQSLYNYLKTVIVRGIANERDIMIYIKHSENISPNRIRNIIMSIIYEATGKMSVSAALTSGENIFTAYIPNQFE